MYRYEIFMDKEINWVINKKRQINICKTFECDKFQASNIIILKFTFHIWPTSKI